MKKESSARDFFSITGVFVIGILSSLYFILLGKILWDWFLVDKLFEITYWELFLGVAIARFILMGFQVGSVEARIDNQVGKLSSLEQSARIISDTIGGTMIFGVFYIVNLIISYYS